MSTSPITDLKNATVVGGATSPREAPSGTLGKDEFLKLLVGQLRHQDPLNPLNDAEFMGQMAQFTQVEQLTNMAKGLELDRAFALIGREVTYRNSEGDLVRGLVERVVTENGKLTLTVNGRTGIDPTSVVQVGLPTPNDPAPADPETPGDPSNPETPGDPEAQ
jgi:flagellar basal-body rod modification protein FlgD